jgi:hypothetical protein
MYAYICEAVVVVSTVKYGALEKSNTPTALGATRGVEIAK